MESIYWQIQLCKKWRYKLTINPLYVLILQLKNYTYLFAILVRFFANLKNCQEYALFIQSDNWKERN